MGGVKDREAKKKAAHVYSAGLGGGTKGPAVVDKRNQELPCPHCDRVFKQVDRYRDHLAKKHPENQEEAGVSDAGANSSTPAPKEQAVLHAVSSAGCVEVSLKWQGCEGQGCSSRLFVSLKAVLQPGSKAGFYIQKSPKMLLLEWTQQQKRLKPRYKTLRTEEGSFRCKVVLADSKKKDLDVVVFLAEDQAAADEEEAQQRGAVAALARVAGDRNFQRVLPQDYRPMWGTCCQQVQEAAVRQEQRAAAAIARKERESRRRAALAKRAPVTAVMSQQQRSRIEEVLQQLRQADVGLTERNRASTGNGEGDSEALVASLVQLGFSEDDAGSAADALGAAAGLAAALDWLCLHIPENLLPASFAPGAAGRPISVRYMPATKGQREYRHQDKEAVEDPAVASLMQWGWPPAACVEALARLRGSPEDAQQDLFGRLTGQAVSPQDPCDDADGALAWEEEQTALEAIFGADVFFPTCRSCCLTIRAEEAPSLEMHVIVPPGSTYPNQVPLIACRGQGFSSKQLLHLTARLAEQASTLVGLPMVHELADQAQELLAGLPDDPPLPRIRPPPQDAQLQQPSQQPSSGKAAGRGMDADQEPSQPVATSRPRLPPTEQHLRLLSRRLLEHQKQLEGSEKHAPMRRTRQRLPAFKERSRVLQQLQQHGVVVVSGATGCGKSTQVPQYILEAAVTDGRGADCNIICTQPRRVSAVGLAARVAQERGEKVGDTVGYSVRLDRRASQNTRLMFCTTGILLRRFLGDPQLQGVTHVVVDEVHERSLDSDLLLLLLRNLVQAQAAAGAQPSIKVILMSATADAELFAQYFASSSQVSAGQLTIPGFTHPVRDMFLEDVLERTQFQIGRRSRWAKKDSGSSNASTSEALQLPAATAPASWDQQGSPAAPEEQWSLQTRQALAVVDEAVLNFDLIEALVCHIVEAEAACGPAALLEGWSEPVDASAMGGAASAILIFMPGAPEIGRLLRALQASPRLKRACPQGVRLLPLHGALSAKDQARCLDSVPPGVRKIVIATNVAETSLTIDDVGCVIDTGRVKEMSFDADRGISRLAEGWVSLASAKQRRGRAGRVRPGACFKLFSRCQAARMQEYQLPEVLRTSLEQLCLTVKANMGTVMPSSQSLAATLAQMLSPPPTTAVASAVASLTALGAFDAQEQLTALGRQLCRMPMDPRVGKACIFACLLRCVGPMLTVVAAVSHGRPVFTSPPDRREEAAAARAQLCGGTAAVKSDHLAVVAAFNRWLAVKQGSGRQEAFRFGQDNFLSESALEAIQAGRAEVAATLVDLGLLEADYHTLVLQQHQSGPSEGTHPADEFSANGRVFKAALCAGFYPSILRVDHPSQKYAQTIGGAFEIDGDPSKLRFLDRHKGRVFIHPGSINFNSGRFDSGWLVFTEMVATSKLYVRESSSVPVYALLLFGGAISVQHEAGTLKLDDWATFTAPARIAVLVRELRQQLDKLLLQHIHNPQAGALQSPVIQVCHELICKDGF